MARIAEMGGAASQAALEYMKERLVASNAARVEAIERGEEIRVGVNAYTETEASPLTAGDGNFVTVDESAEAEQIARLQAWRAARDDEKAVPKRWPSSNAPREDDTNLMPPSIACAKAGVTTGEWAARLRKVFGEYRAPTGVAATGARAQRRTHRRAARRSRCRLAEARPQAHLPGRQARPRWPFQRRRTDRHPRPRCRHGRDL